MSTAYEETLYWLAGNEERLHRALDQGFWDEAVVPPDVFATFRRFHGVDVMTEQLLSRALADPATSPLGLRIVLPVLLIEPYQLALIPPDRSVAALGPLWTMKGSRCFLPPDRAGGVSGIPPYGRYVVPAHVLNREAKAVTPLSPSQFQLIASQTREARLKRPHPWGRGAS